MDELERAAELINRALDALSIAAVRNPERRADFAAQCERLRLLMEEVEAARQNSSAQPQRVSPGVKRGVSRLVRR
jgi:hypothetical protein